MATISNTFASNFVSNVADNNTDSFVESLKKRAGKSLTTVAVKVNMETEGELSLRRVTKEGEVLDIRVPEFVTVGLDGADGDVIETANLRWFSKNHMLATMGAFENLQHVYEPLANAEIGKFFLVKKELPMRGTIALIKLDAWLGAPSMKNVRIGNFNFAEIHRPDNSFNWTDDSGRIHICQWFGLKAISPTTCVLFGIGADNAERDANLTDDVLKSERYGREYMNLVCNQMTNLLDGKRYRIQTKVFEMTGHHKGDGSEFTFEDWSLVNDIQATIRRYGLSREEAIEDRRVSAYAAKTKQRTDVAYSRAEKAGEIAPITEHTETGVKTGFVPAAADLSDEAKAKNLAFIWADFGDGQGMNLVSINDDRFSGFFVPSWKTGLNVKPAQSPKQIRSARDVRSYRISGMALVKLAR